MNTQPFDKIYFGAAYYDEYMPESRIDEDLRLMKEAGMNLIRIAESTWSTWEPREGEFDFTSLHRMLQGAERHGLSVIVGTPTYAIPPWLYRKYPDILAETRKGTPRYGCRQLMDITHPGYRKHSEIIIRRLLAEVQPYRCVIGFQLDNETKPYDTCGPRVQALFKEHLMRKFGTVEALNKAYGFAYWSNSLGSWDDLPDVRGTINGSYAAEFEDFRRGLVTEFFAWQKAIVDEYRRPDQFITHNFDFEWHEYSYGFQPEVDHFAGARLLDVAGCDIYHPSGDDLTGTELSLCSDIARGLKGTNYLVLETQAQGRMGWLPHPGQLYQLGFSHIAGGAVCVEYWHWHSIHNAIETYWKGVLSHDLTPGAVYHEAARLGNDLARLSPRLSGLTIRNRAAMILSNRSLTGITHSYTLAGPTYNDLVRNLYDALFRRNIGVDILPDTARDFGAYDLVITPCLYCADDGLIDALRAYVEQGGHLLSGPRSFFTDPNLQVRHEAQPYHMTDVFGMTYDTFTVPVHVPDVKEWMELLRPAEGTRVLRRYDHYAYEAYAWATLHDFGRGRAAWIGAMTEPDAMEELLQELLPELGIAVPDLHWPVIHKTGISRLGRAVHFYFNYSGESRTFTHPRDAVELISGTPARAGEEMMLERWGVRILEECTP